jgi:low temperature requirement protein LtrA
MPQDSASPDRRERETVVPLELFLDLVIVFAFTQVTTLMSRDPTWTGLLDGVLVFVAVWWLWTGFARLTNAVDPEEGVVRIVILGATAAMLVLSLAAPHAFGRDAVQFAAAYAVARGLHVVLAAIAAARGDALRREMLRLIPNAVAASGLLLAAALLHGSARLVCWLAVAAISYFGLLLLNGSSSSEVSASHFVERFGQIVLIALGESIIAIGIGAGNLRLDGSVIAAAILGFTTVACLWWTYFDWVIYVVLLRFAEASPSERATLARDVHAYLHSVMVAGIVLFAFGVEVALHDVRDTLGIIPATGLAGGVALYLIAHVALRLRIGGGLGHGRPVAAVLLLAAIPAILHVSALTALGAVASVVVALVAYEVLRRRDERAAIRGSLAH